jgi:hypothetical protein
MILFQKSIDKKAATFLRKAAAFSQHSPNTFSLFLSLFEKQKGAEYFMILFGADSKRKSFITAVLFVSRRREKKG